jgi:hypothetical protein
VVGGQLDHGGGLLQSPKEVGHEVARIDGGQLGPVL